MTVGSSLCLNWSLYCSKSFIFILATPVFIAALATDAGITLISLGSKVEGIIPALETSHAIAYTMKLAKKMKKNQNIVINLSGRGDKDLNTVAKLEGIKI